MKVIRIDFPPHRDASHKLSAASTSPPALSTDDMTPSGGRPRIPPPREAFDFLPDLMAKKEGEQFKLREDVKPLHILQPEGVSFSMNGHELEWQKWKMHVGEINFGGCRLQFLTECAVKLSAIERESLYRRSLTTTTASCDQSSTAFR